MFESTLIGREPAAFGTTAFHFAKPEGFDFAPGQVIDLIIGRPGENADDTKHAFSIVGALRNRDLTLDHVARDGLRSPIWYAAGPPAMAEGMTQILRLFDVPANDIRSESFFGY